MSKMGNLVVGIMEEIANCGDLPRDEIIHIVSKKLSCPDSWVEYQIKENEYYDFCQPD